jgi:hypothetical protein
VLGGQHHRSSPAAAVEPRWLVITERGLFTGTGTAGVVGTGKTSACMYPCVEPLIAYRVRDPARQVGGLILEVKGNFGRYVRDLLRIRTVPTTTSRSASPQYSDNPLHNALDA